jgi:galactokinase
MLRSSLNPVSPLDLSVQARFIWLDETAVAVRLVGAAGVGCVVALTAFENGE